MDRLKEKTLKSVFWFSLEKFGAQIIQLILSVVLARLLTPSDYGKVGMVLVFLSISNMIIEGGFTSALIRKKDADKNDYDTVFMFNLSSSVILFVILVFISPMISTFYKISELKEITIVISLNLIILSFSFIQSTILSKKINFKIQTKIAIISILISSLVAFLLAYLKYGYWALVFQTLLMNLVKTILLWKTIGWRPRFKFNIHSFKELFSFGSKIFLSNILETVYQNFYQLVIGKIFSTQVLGLYSQAKKIEETPTSSFSQIIQKVTYPVYATIQEDDARLKNGLKKSLILTMFINIPLMLFLLFASDSFIEVFLSHKWIDASIYLKLLSLIGIITPLQSLNLNIIKVKGRSGLFLKLQTIKVISGISLAIIGLYWGIIGLLISQIVSTYFSFSLNSYYSGELINYKIYEQLRDILPYCIISGISCVPIAITQVLITDFYLQFVLQILSASILYFILNLIFRTKGYLEIKFLSKTYLKFKTT